MNEALLTTLLAVIAAGGFLLTGYAFARRPRRRSADELRTEGEIRQIRQIREALFDDRRLPRPRRTR